MQNEVKNPCVIPSTNGIIENPGFSRLEVMKYQRKNIHAPWYRKKEWDYYLFTNSKFGIAFTISDLGYIGLLSVSFIDFVEKKEHTESELVLFPKGKKFNLGETTKDATASCHTKRLDMVFENQQEHRHIYCKFKNFNENLDFECDLEVYETMDEAMFIATPWKEKATAFYYNCKKNNLSANGYLKYGDRKEIIKKEETIGCLDWGRGVWTYDNTWYWGTGSGYLGNEPFGFNLGYGFSDRSSASENCIYFRGKIHKLSLIEFHIPIENDKKDYLSPWKITSDDGRFEATFKPILDRSANMNYLLIASNQHQVFGKMDGFAILDDGVKIEFQDFICALEEVRNKY